MTPTASTAQDKPRRWPRILGFGCLGIVLVFGVLIAWVWYSLVPSGDGGRTQHLLEQHAVEHHPDDIFHFSEDFDKARHMHVRAELHYDDALTTTQVTALEDFMSEQFVMASERDWSVLQSYTLIFPDGEIHLKHADEVPMVRVASELLVDTSVASVSMGAEGNINAGVECAFDDAVCRAEAAEAALFGFDRVIAARADFAQSVGDEEAPFYYYNVSLTYTDLPSEYEHNAASTSVVSARMRGSGEDFRDQYLDMIAAWPYLTSSTGGQDEEFGYFVYAKEFTLQDTADAVEVRAGYDYVAGSVTEADKQPGKEQLIEQLSDHGGSTAFVVN